MAPNLLFLISMMQLNHEGALGLYILHSLACKESPVGTREVARRARADISAVARMLRRLRRAGLVRAVRGRGFTLARAAGTIRVLEVLDTLGGGVSAAC